MKSILAIAAFVLLAPAIRTSAEPASFGGAWSAKVPAPNGQQRLDVVFTFKMDGSRLSGTASANGMTFDLVDARADGDHIAFTIDGDTGRYVGTLAGDEIKMQAIYKSSENGTRTWKFVAKRVAPPPGDSPSITGTWTGEVPRGGDQFVHAVFDLEGSGSTLGGVVHALDLDLPVTRGRIDGTHLSFNVGESKGDYTGEIAGDVIRMTVKYSGGETGRATFEFVLKRVTPAAQDGNTQAGADARTSGTARHSPDM